LTDKPTYDREFSPNKWLQSQKKRLGLSSVEPLKGMSKNKDPFGLGTAGDFDKAEWFGRIHEAHGYAGVHLRKLHYRYWNTGEAVLPDGSEYENREEHWNVLVDSSKLARVLHVVDADDFRDNRNNQSPSITMSGATFVTDPAYYIAYSQFSAGRLPWSAGALEGPEIYPLAPFSEPERYVTGYEYEPGMQANHIEIWSEVEWASIHGIARRLGVNYIPLKGFASITNIQQMLRRIRRGKKGARILYISDYDPSGQAMPTQVSRYAQLSVWELTELAQQVAPDIKIHPIAITLEQVQRFGLPPKPLSEKMIKRYGYNRAWELGAVEVEALDEFHPGELEKIVEGEVTKLLDTDLRDDLVEAEDEAEKMLDKAVQDAILAHGEDLADVYFKAAQVKRRYDRLYEQAWDPVAERFRRLSSRFRREMRPHERELARVEGEIKSDLMAIDLELPDLPEAEAPDEDGRVYLFDSSRRFVDQTNRLRAYKGKPTPAFDPDDILDEDLEEDFSEDGYEKL
jgi:hypothetical protein